MKNGSENEFVNENEWENVNENEMKEVLYNTVERGVKGRWGVKGQFLYR